MMCSLLIIARLSTPLLLIAAAMPSYLIAQVAVQGKMIYTMAGPPIENGTIVVREGKIAAIGKSTDVTVCKRSASCNCLTASRAG